MAFFPFRRARPEGTRTVTVTTEKGATFTWPYRVGDQGLDCLVFNAAQARHFAHGPVAVTFTTSRRPDLITGKTTGHGIAQGLSGDALNDALLAFIDADESAWALLAIPKTYTGKSKAVTIVQILLETENEESHSGR